MSKKNSVVLLIILLIVGAILLLMKSEQGIQESSDIPEVPVTHEKSTPQDETKNEIEAKINSPSESLPATEKSMDFAEKIKIFKPVTIEQARKEVAKNPHTTPEVLITSALSLGSLFDSVTNQDQAQQFLAKISECAKEDADTPTSFQANCLQYAKRIEKKYPELKSAVESIFSQASQQAREIEKMTTL